MSEPAETSAPDSPASAVDPALIASPQVEPISLALPEARGSGRGCAVTLLAALALLLSLCSLLAFVVTFQILQETIVRALGRSANLPITLPMLLATLGAWGVMYLLYDHFEVIGDRAIHETATRRAQAWLTQQAIDASVTDAVEVSSLARVPGLPDFGAVALTERELLIVGDSGVVRIPRSVCVRAVHRKTVSGMGAEWVSIDTSSSWKTLRLVPRPGTRRLSDNGQSAQALAQSLNRWLSAGR